MLFEDAAAGKLHAPKYPDPDAIIALLHERGIAYTTWDGWYRRDAEERRLGETSDLLPRERRKIVEWEEMVAHARAVPQVP